MFLMQQKAKEIKINQSYAINLLRLLSMALLIGYENTRPLNVPFKTRIKTSSIIINVEKKEIRLTGFGSIHIILSVALFYVFYYVKSQHVKYKRNLENTASAQLINAQSKRVGNCCDETDRCTVFSRFRLVR